MPQHADQRSAESVTCGHPDKVCDQISDAVLDAALAGDPNSRVAMETAGKSQYLLFGEMTTKSELDLPAIALRVHGEIGYYPEETHGVMVDVVQQSPDIALINTEDQGAGDQGLMYGFATWNPMFEHMPTPIMLAHALTNRLTEVRRNGTCSWMRPDGKSQVNLDDEGNVEHVTIAIQHKAEIDLPELRRQVYEHVIVPVVGDIGAEKCTINGTGAFVLGGCAADAGLTGRKIVVDAYGGGVPVGGGAFSGKDPSKVDRSAAYFARYIAKSLVAREMAQRALVELTFTINGFEPDKVRVWADGVRDSNQNLVKYVRENFPLSPSGMIKHLGLTTPNGWRYQDTAAGGHFGRPQFPWEKVS